MKKQSSSKRRWATQLILATCLSACATGPKVQQVPRGQGDASERVLYALPRAMVVATVPVTFSTFVSTPLTAEIPKTCTFAERLDMRDACYWRFRSKDPGADGALLACVQGAASHYLFPGEAPTVVTVPVPDPDRVFAVSLRARGFERLTVGLTLSQGGAPSSLKYEATAPFLDTLKTVIGAARMLTSTSKALLFATGNQSVSSASVAQTDLQMVVDALATLEQARLNLAKSPGATQASLDAIRDQQSVLRALVEGSVRPVEDKFILLFDPENLEDSERRTARRISMVNAGKGDPLLPCDPRTTTDWILKLTPQPDALAFAKANLPSASDKEDGFKYRVPLFTEAVLEIGNPPVSGDPPNLRVAAPVVVPQWGWVRSLPRRIGLGAGSLEATLDPATGALTKVGSMADNTAGLDATRAVLGEIERQRADPAPPDVKSELERQVAICAARHRLGMPLEGDCASFRSED